MVESLFSGQVDREGGLRICKGQIAGVRYRSVEAGDMIIHTTEGLVDKHELHTKVCKKLGLSNPESIPARFVGC